RQARQHGARGVIEWLGALVDAARNGNTALRATLVGLITADEGPDTGELVAATVSARARNYHAQPERGLLSILTTAYHTPAPRRAAVARVRVDPARQRQPNARDARRAHGHRRRPACDTAARRCQRRNPRRHAPRARARDRTLRPARGLRRLRVSRRTRDRRRRPAAREVSAPRVLGRRQAARRTPRESVREARLGSRPVPQLLLHRASLRDPARRRAAPRGVYGSTGRRLPRLGHVPALRARGARSRARRGGALQLADARRLDRRQRRRQRLRRQLAAARARDAPGRDGPDESLHRGAQPALPGLARLVDPEVARRARARRDGRARRRRRRDG